MEPLTHLLALPFELRDLIWGFSASTGDANGLSRCCRQTRDEFAAYCVLPENVHQLHKLRILVDSTYDHGIWLKFDYYWEQNGHIRHAIAAVQDMDDPIAGRLIMMNKIDDLIVHLHAPRRGHFVGALLMMLAKAEDVYCFIHQFTVRRENEKGDVGRYTIRYSTEMIQPGQSTKEAKNFWECRSPKVLADPLRKYLENAGQMPCFYEYLLINCPSGFPAIPTIEYITWPRRHTYRHHTLSIPENNYKYRPNFGNKEIQAISDEMRNLQKYIARYSAMMMTSYRLDTSDETRYEEWASPAQSSWEHINYDTLNLKSRYQFLLDSLTGPVGGCLDMLRLHRFRTMDASGLNFFARSERRGTKDNTGLAGASSKINRRLRALFHPYATEDIRNMRSTCPHLRAVAWSTDNSNLPIEPFPRSIWLDHYPNGIRYHGNGRNIVEWHLRWETKKDRNRRDEWILWLSKRWECMGCCQDSTSYMSKLASPFERRRLQSSNAPGKICHHSTSPNRRTSGQDNLDRPMILRRECVRRVREPGPMGKKWKPDFCGYRYLSWECKSWTLRAPSKLTAKSKDKLGMICTEFSVQAIYDGNN